MRRPLWLLNLLLGVVAVLAAVVLIRTWVGPIASPTLNQTVTTKPLHEAEALAYNPTARPPINQFDILLDKNPFKQPPALPAQSVAVAPQPLPTLIGTILAGHERRAILSDKGKSNIYSIGQAIAGGVIAEIKEDRILFKRGDTTQEIMLKAAIESGTALPARPGVPVGGQAAAARSLFESGQSMPLSSSDTELSASDAYTRRRERLRQKQERRQRLLEQ